MPHIRKIFPEFLLVIIELFYLIGLALILILQLADNLLLMQNLSPELLYLILVKFLGLIFLIF